MKTRIGPVRDWVEQIFHAAGLTKEASVATANCLTFAEVRGVKSHGFIRVPIYLERLAAGGIAKEGVTTVKSDQGALVLLDGGHAIGPITGVDASRLAIERAKIYGIGCTIAANANHFGAASYYTDLMADHGMFAIAVCNTDKAMSPPLGGKKVLGTNPIAISAPLPKESRPQLDMATSLVSLGKLLVASQSTASLPEGWAVDENGAPTTSADRGIRGALLPAAGPKGFGLAFMIDTMVAIAGAETSPNVGPLYGDPAEPQRLGLAFIAIRVSQEGLSAAKYETRIRELIDHVHESGPGPTGLTALMPGEPELQFERTHGGLVELSDGLVKSLHCEATRYGVDLYL